jgi:hypothetical protein
MKLTVIEMDDWAFLFENDKLVHQDHSISPWELTHYAKGQPFFLEVIAAYETEFEAKIMEDGCCDQTMHLSYDVMPLLKKKKKS